MAAYIKPPLNGHKVLYKGKRYWCLKSLKIIHLRITKAPVNFLSLISQLAQFVDGAIYPMMGHT